MLQESTEQLSQSVNKLKDQFRKTIKDFGTQEKNKAEQLAKVQTDLSALSESKGLIITKVSNSV